MMAEESLNMRCSMAGSTTAVIIVVKKKSCIYILINLCKFKVEVRNFHKKNANNWPYKSDNFYDIQNSIRILLDSLMTKNYAKC